MESAKSAESQQRLGFVASGVRNANSLGETLDRRKQKPASVL
jgi:hypothetical protein